ncbi:protein rdm1 [Phtheirospermum japonicum]|uniref:Protein rdm1 n=1 Tax=Phtheirospermum japonicum TaxID=374723 RepID=A0A830BG09_9LAMI|nr:protein rdm1 [Phtheirospermum japonicum]
MKRPMPFNEQVEILSDDSSSSDADNGVFRNQLLNEDLPLELSSEAWLFRRAKSYQQYMKLIPIPTKRGTVIPYTSWTGLGTSMKNIYSQPLHYLTNLHLKRLDQERLGAEDEDVLLYTIIHPAKAEASIWIIEEVHRLTASPHHLAKLWAADTYYHAYIDDIYPKLGD